MASSRRLPGFFFNQHGLRPIVGVPLFYAMYKGVDMLLRGWGGPSIASDHAILVKGMLVREACQLLGVTLLVAVLSWAQGESVLRWGYRDQRWIKHLATGLACGFLYISTLVVAMWAGGLLVFDNASAFSSESLGFATLWGVVFVMVGLFEESLLRGYLQFVLTRNMGFWKASLVLSLLFTLMHAFNHGETVMGLATVFGFAIVACASLWYTGTLWWVIGFHIAWDWTQSIFYGAPTSGLQFEGHLLTSHPQGSLLWSGGSDGPEGSPLMLVWMAASVVLMHVAWAKRRKPFVAD